MIDITPYATTEKFRTQAAIAHAVKHSPLGEHFGQGDQPITRYLATELALVWQGFSQRIHAVPFIQKLEQSQLTLEDYKTLLINLRQQVVEGGRWIARAASSMEPELFALRSLLIGHAADEHRDFLMLDKMYARLGGSPEEIAKRPRNVGSEALTAYMFHQLTQSNPVQFFGAMFIIEGLGALKAGPWAELIKTQLGLAPADVIFLSYHADNDDSHFDKLRHALSLPLITQESAEKIVKMARVVGRLYCLQLEELDHI
jgi:3-oxoacyl-[acyl-carrier-protein] synthase III